MLQRLQCVMRGLVFAAGVAALVPASAAEFGPWNAEVAGGVGLQRPLPENSPSLAADARWIAYGWINVTRPTFGKQLLAGLGDPDGEARYSMIDAGRLGFWWSADRALSSNAQRLPGPHWQPWDDAQHFAGRIAGLTVGDIALDAARVAVLARTPPDASTRCEPASPRGRGRRGRWPGR